jgi:hypothetical protein
MIGELGHSLKIRLGWIGWTCFTLEITQTNCDSYQFSITDLAFPIMSPHFLLI